MSENTMNNLKIGVDVGGTKIEAVLVDAMGTVLGSARIPARHGNDAVIEDIVAVAHQAAGERFDEVRAIGIGTPGTVDSASGHVGNIVNLDVVSLDMGPLVSQRSGVPAMWKTTSMPPPSARPPYWAVRTAWPVPLRS